MFTRVTQLVIVLVAIVMFVAFDSGSNLHADVEGPSESGWDVSEGNSVIAVLGEYELRINPYEMSATLEDMREPLDIRVSGIRPLVAGHPFFTISKDDNCFSLTDESPIFINDSFILEFNIKHPIDPGTSSEPPSETNRLDLDIFDFAMVIAPQGKPPVEYPEVEYPEGGLSIYEDAVSNADGYTRELQYLVNDEAARPYVLVVDDCEFGINTNNKFAMGATANVDVVFPYDGSDEMVFDIYLTAGLGVSVVDQELLMNPLYFIPEFNRKAPWKTISKPLSDGQSPCDNLTAWVEGDSDTEYLLVVSVYDSQVSATVYPGDDFSAANVNEDNIVDEIRAESGVESVTVRISEVLNLPITISGDEACGRGTADDPLVYLFPFANVNSKPEGTYDGSVTVFSSDMPPSSAASDYNVLLDSPDGVQIDSYVIPEFAIYSDFTFEIKAEPYSGYPKISGSISSPITFFWEVDHGSSVDFDVQAISKGGSGVIGRIYADFDYEKNYFTIDAESPLNPYDGRWLISKNFINNHPDDYSNDYYRVVFVARDTSTYTAFATCIIKVRPRNTQANN